MGGCCKSGANCGVELCADTVNVEVDTDGGKPVDVDTFIVDSNSFPPLKEPTTILKRKSRIVVVDEELEQWLKFIEGKTGHKPRDYVGDEPGLPVTPPSGNRRPEAPVAAVDSVGSVDDAPAMTAEQYRELQRRQDELCAFT